MGQGGEGSAGGNRPRDPHAFHGFRDAWARLFSPDRRSPELAEALDRLARRVVELVTRFSTVAFVAAVVVVVIVLGLVAVLAVGFAVDILRLCGLLPSHGSHLTPLRLAPPVGLLVSLVGGGGAWWHRKRKRRAQSRREVGDSRQRLSGAEEVEQLLDRGDGAAPDEDPQLEVLAGDPGSGDVGAADVGGAGVGGEHLEVRPRSVVTEAGFGESTDVSVPLDDPLQLAEGRAGSPWPSTRDR